MTLIMWRILGQKKFPRLELSKLDGCSLRGEKWIKISMKLEKDRNIKKCFIFLGDIIAVYINA